MEPAHSTLATSGPRRKSTSTISFTGEEDEPLDLCTRSVKRSLAIWSPASLCEQERQSAEEHSPCRSSRRNSTDSWDGQISPCAQKVPSSERTFQVRKMLLNPWNHSYAVLTSSQSVPAACPSKELPLTGGRCVDACCFRHL